MNSQSHIAPLSVSIDDAARMLGVARSTLYEQIAKGNIHSFKVGRRRLIRVRDLETFINYYSEGKIR